MIIIPTKWLFHWEYTLFSDKPIWDIFNLTSVRHGMVTAIASEHRGCWWCFYSESLTFSRYAATCWALCRWEDRLRQVHFCRPKPEPAGGSSVFQASRLAAELEKKAMPAFSVFLSSRFRSLPYLCLGFNGQVHQTFKQSNEDSWLKKAAREASAFSLQVAHSRKSDFFLEWKCGFHLFQADLMLDEEDDTREVGKSKAVKHRCLLTQWDWQCTIQRTTCGFSALRWPRV